MPRCRLSRGKSTEQSTQKVSGDCYKRIVARSNDTLRSLTNSQRGLVMAKENFDATRGGCGCERLRGPRNFNIMGKKQPSAAPSELCDSCTSAAPDIITPATVRTVHRRGKSMSRRTGQNGSIEMRNGAWRGRYLVDVPGQAERQKRSVVLGFKKEMTKSEAKRKLKEIIRQEGIDLPTYAIPSSLSFAQKVEQWEKNYVAKRKPSNQDLIHYHLKVYLLKKWGKTPVDLITPEAVDEWVGAPELAHLAPATIKGIVRTLQLALGKKFGKAISYPSQGEVESDPRCYVAEEVQQIVETAKRQDN